MGFLQPMLLAALPLAALPIIIHLINQRRYQSVRWGAMMFLLAANRMSRGYARLRQWLIMAFRIAAIVALVVAVSRPLAGGWLGLAAGGRADTTILILDRSPSMEQGTPGTGGSKRETARRQLARTLGLLGSSRWVLIESTSGKPRALEKIDDLMSSPAAGPSGASADLPALLQAARDYLRANKSGRAEIWIGSDLRANDWNPDGGRWPALRDAFLEFPQGVRFHLLAYPQTAPANRAVRVTDVRRRPTAEGAELLVSLTIARDGTKEAAETVPVQFEIDGARSETTVALAGPRSELKEYRIPLDKDRKRGWGKVALPADANPADNDFWFTFDEPAPRRTLVVADDPQAARPLELAAAITPDPAVTCSAEVVGEEQLATVEWDQVALLLWQAPLPEGGAAKLVRAFLDRGGHVVFFPPQTPAGRTFLGTRWDDWSEGKELPVETWRGDQDLLAQTQSGTALPVGQLVVKRSCGLSGEFTPLATLRGGAPLLTRVSTNRGGAYFCATTPAPGDSSLATEGVVFYVLIQRALAGGAAALGSTRNLVAGDPAGEDPAQWRRLAGDVEALSTESASQCGIYASGDRLLAVNRAAVEDGAPVLADARVAGLFRGLDFARVDDRAGNLGSLIQEVWRLFLIGMMVSMVVEAGLCLPRQVRRAGGTP